MKTLNLTGKKVAVIGSRTFADKKRLYDVLNKNKDKIKLIISGGARGADTLATEWAKDYGVPYLVFPACWHDENGEYDRGAGFRRNYYIIKYCDVCLAFWDLKSNGTAHSLDIAKQLNKPIKIISFQSPEEQKSLLEEGEPNKQKMVSTDLGAVGMIQDSLNQLPL